MDSFQILVIILSVMLAIFLFLSIVVLVYVLKIVQSLKEVSDKASSAVDNVSNVAVNIGKFVTPAAAGKLVVDIVQKFFKHEKGSKE